MRISRQSWQLLKKMNSKLDMYSLYFPTPLTLQGLKSFGENPIESKSFNFLRHEIPIRLAHIVREMNLLPSKLRSMSSIEEVIRTYEESFGDIIAFESSSATQYSELSAFTDSLLHLRECHNNIVETIGKAVGEMHENLSVESGTNDQLQYFLDRFFINRIGIRMLICQHVSLFGLNVCENDRLAGCVDESCDLLSNVIRAYKDASFMCSTHLRRAPLCDVQLELPHNSQFPNENSSHCGTSSLRLSPTISKDGTDEIKSRAVSEMSSQMKIVYVPHHLHYVLFELFKNAMRAVIEATNAQEDSLPALLVRIVRGKEDITIQISDRGNGISHHILDQERIFRYTYSTAPKSMSAFPSPMAGFGFGLPLSRLYMRYFNGDLRISSVQGYGTDAFIYLKRNPAEAEELLPIFNHTSASHYVSTPSRDSTEWDWSGKDNTTSHLFPHVLPAWNMI